MKTATARTIPTEQYLSVKRVAERLDTSAASIWRWSAAGTFPKPIRLTPGSTRWKLSDIEKWERGQAEGVE